MQSYIGDATRKFEESESRSRREEKRVNAMLKDTKAQLKMNSDAVLDLKRQLGELKEQNASLRSQLDPQPKGEIAVKEEELTDDEEMIARLNK